MKQSSVLIIGAVWVEPTSSAAGSRMLQLIDYFIENNYTITFATTSLKNENSIDLHSLGIKVVSIELNAASFDEFIAELNPEIVLFDRFMTEEQFGWRVAETCPNAIRILDTEDLHSLRKIRQDAVRKERLFSIDDLLNSDIAKREIAAILRSDLSLIISSFEMELLLSTFRIDKSLLFHLPFLLNPIEDIQIASWPKFEERTHFVTVGNFLHPPNVDGVIQLKNTIWNKIRRKLPKAEMHIYGAYAKQQIVELHNEKEGFLIKGFVEDAENVVSNARVVLAPLRFGAGIKGKLTEAMICGTPSVTTSIGAEGMHNGLPWNGFVTDEFEDFANRAIELYSNQKTWELFQHNGIEIINQLYNKESLNSLFQERILTLSQQLKTHRTFNFIGSVLQHESMRSTKYMSKWIEEKNKTSN